MGLIISGLVVDCARTTSTPMPTPTWVPTPTFAFGKFGSSEMDITYCTPNNMPQKLDVYYPSAGGPWPVVMYVHGGAWNSGDKAEGLFLRGLTNQGFLLVSVNYRLATNGNKFPVMIEDVKCAVRYLRAFASKYNLDPHHIGAIGASAGAHLVALLGTTDQTAGWDTPEYADQSSRVQAVVTLAGFSDFTRPVDEAAAMAIQYGIAGVPSSDSPKMVAASPITYITSDDPPFLIIHGDQDKLAPLEQSQILDEHLRSAGVASTLVIVKNGEHSLQGNNLSPSAEEIMQMIVTFFEMNLK